VPDVEDLPKHKDFQTYLNECNEISQSLYPDDSTEHGKLLRLKQQYFFVCAGIASLFVSSPAKVAVMLQISTVVPLLAVGIVLICTVLPFVLYTKGLAEIESGKAAILASVEPVAAAFVGVIAFGEPLTASVVMGLVCILSAVYILR
jgi:drug/metabolite transporter (DMT)-like permease